MPCDNYKTHEVDIAFQETVYDIEEMIMKNDDATSISIAGDVNIDISRDNAHTKCMWDLCEVLKLSFTRLHTNANYSYIYANVFNGVEYRSTITI